MATYSNIGIKLITTGDESGTWGDTTNTNFSGVLDEAIAGVVTYNISSDADVTLTVSDGSSSDARHAVINFTSTTLSATRTVTFAPDTLQKTWLVINSTTGGQSLTFKQGSVGATITVANGESAWIYSDGAGATNGAITKALDSFTNTKITTGTLNATTLDLTNLEVTNVKAKDGTAAFSIADSTGKVTVSSELAVDNLNLSGNAITSTNTDGNIDLTPNGTGEVNITKVDIDAGAIDGTTIGGASAAAGTFTTLTATTLGGALDANNQAITNINVDSGAIDGTPIGANSASTGAFTTATATTGNITTVNATTVDTTNVEVTAIKAKDGTAAATIADSTGVVTIGSSVLTTADINGGTIDGTTIGGASAAAGTFTSLNSSSASTFNGGVVINELGADADTRIEGDTDANLFFVDASADNVGIGTASPIYKMDLLLGAGSGNIVRFGQSGVSNGYTITTNGSALTHEWANSGSVSMAFTSSGNLGIGTSSPQYKLQVRRAGGAGSLGVSIDSVGAISRAVQYFSVGDSTNVTAGHAWYYRPATATDTVGMVLNGDGNLGIGTSSPAQKLHVASAGNNYIVSSNTAGSTSALLLGSESGQNTIYSWTTVAGSTGRPLAFYTGASESMRLDTSGNLGLGVTPSASSVKTFEISAAGNTLSGIGGGDIALMSNAYFNSGFKYAGSNLATSYRQQDGVHKWNIAASGTAGDPITFTQAMTLDADGNLGVGTASPGAKLDVATSSGDCIIRLGNGTSQARFAVDNDGPYIYPLTSGDLSLRVFTPAGGTAATITAGGDLLVGKTTTSLASAGVSIEANGTTACTVSGAQVLIANRNTNDGTIVSLRQDQNEEGSISVSGSTVSYNAFAGSHWSQLQDGSKPDILRGTVMEAINELCVWPNEENERLPKAKISDTAGSRKVYGVFMAWDNDWATTNDMYVTAVGAFICRVNASVTVQEGDLLESNGDGTARVQADDIIRSSTIGKVTSTVKTHEYDDGSYCVPTVLYCG